MSSNPLPRHICGRILGQSRWRGQTSVAQSQILSVGTGGNTAALAGNSRRVVQFRLASGNRDLEKRSRKISLPGWDLAAPSYSSRTEIEQVPLRCGCLLLDVGIAGPNAPIFPCGEHSSHLAVRALRNLTTSSHMRNSRVCPFAPWLLRTAPVE